MEVPPFKKDGEWIIGSDEALNMTDLPLSMAIVGGGKRGVEFGTFFNTFGVPVTLIETGKSNTSEDGSGDLHPV